MNYRATSEEPSGHANTTRRFLGACLRADGYDRVVRHRHDATTSRSEIPR